MPNPAPGTRTLKIISYNIQAAIGSEAPSHYVTRVHRQFLHTKAKDDILRKVGKTIEPYDIACLQEIDLGGRRSNFESQVKGLFAATTFTDATFQENRVVRKISRHGNVILSRQEMDDAHDLKLPAKMGGRGALIACYPLTDTEHLTVVNLHLSLGEAEQVYQLEHLADEIDDHRHVVVCGDFNTFPTSPSVKSLIKACKLKYPGRAKATYPSWGPRHALDHILVSNHIKVENYGPLKARHSDHLPVAATLTL